MQFSILSTLFLASLATATENWVVTFYTGTNCNAGTDVASFGDSVAQPCQNADVSSTLKSANAMLNGAWSVQFFPEENCGGVPETPHGTGDTECLFDGEYSGVSEYKSYKIAAAV